MSTRWEFLGSNRFWAIVIAAVSIYLQGKGWIGEPEMIMIASISSAFAIVRTVDRAVEVTGTGKMPPQPEQ